MQLSSDEEEALLLFALIEDENQRPLKKKRKWINSVNADRTLYGEYNKIMPQLRQDEKSFYLYYRMNFECFDEILNLILNRIQKRETNCREVISAGERLAIFLRLLATGETYKKIGQQFRVGYSTVHMILKEVCEAICEKMGNIYLPEPSTELWQEAAQDFKTRWGFPNCIGCIDLKYTIIRCPVKSGPKFSAYMKKYAMVLQTIIGPDQKFISVNVTNYESEDVDELLTTSEIGQKLSSYSMNIPQDTELPGQNVTTPHFLLGDEAFSLRPYLMRPYPSKSEKFDENKKKFNCKLRSTRQVVDDTFKLMSQRWKLFCKPQEVSVETKIIVFKTACILHNYLKTKKSDNKFFEYLELPQSTIGAFGNFRSSSRRSQAYASQIRQRFADYFSTNV